MDSDTDLILYAEDDPNDAFIFQMAFKRATLPQALSIVEDGQSVIDWLEGKRANPGKATPIPAVLILDLKMPRKSGFDVLQYVRKQGKFETLPVIILSSSDEPRDVKRAYKLGATTYFVKSTSFQDVIQYLRQIRK